MADPRSRSVMLAVAVLAWTLGAAALPRALARIFKDLCS